MSKLKTYANYLLATVFLIILWHLASVIVDKPFLPRPLGAIKEFFRLFGQGIITGHFLISTYRVMVSTILAFVLAVPLGMLLGRNKRLDSFCPLIYILYPLPKVVFLPILVVFRFG